MNLILLTGISRNSSALPRGAAALKVEGKAWWGLGAGRSLLMAVGGGVW